MIIRPVTPQDAPQVARIHAESISSGFISSLPSGFVEKLYKEVAKSRNAFGFVCEDGSKVVGFICGSLDTNRLFKDLILKKGLVLAIPLLKYVFNFDVFRKILNNMF